MRKVGEKLELKQLLFLRVYLSGILRTQSELFLYWLHYNANVLAAGSGLFMCVSEIILPQQHGPSSGGEGPIRPEYANSLSGDRIRIYDS